ncbi:MAG: DUF885 family protein [Hyphomonadaceae bacterium]|nr:DUF885 family protein [Hyphomonadaceae bacterium]
MLMHRRAFLGATAAVAALSVSGCNGAGSDGSELSSLLTRLSTDILRESPESATALAVSEEQAGGSYNDRLSDATREGLQRYKGILETGLRDLRALDRDSLADADKVSLDVVATSFENDIEDLGFAPSATAPYVVSQLTGSYSYVPDFLDSQHPLTNRAQVDGYLARLTAFARNMDVESGLIASDAAAGLSPPDFAIDKTLTQLQGMAAMRPADTVMVQSLARRILDVAEIPEADRAGFTSRAEAIVRDEILPAYGRQIEALRAIRANASHDAGCWRLPQGEERYAAAIKNQTTTNMTPDEIHQMGVDLVASLNSEMDAILRAEGMTRGTLQERLAELNRRPDQLYPNTDAGREQLLSDLNAQVEAIKARCPEYFAKLAQADLRIVRVPVYTEVAAPGGYYNGAALDGSRPGLYYINLRDTRELPKYTLPTLTYHEGIPGHHWQISIAQESEGLPFIRSALLGFNAYQEGWALYAEQLADEMGMYANDAFGRVGYLQSAAFRASRLVVDTGMHSKRWSREQAIRSMVEATGNDEASTITEIERYSVWPGQACGYMVGRQAIVRMREAARTALGDKFDIKGFHDTLLVNGATPLSVTESLVQAWTAERQNS